MNSNSQEIAVISYNTPHRKTQDVLFGLKAKAYNKVTVLALPFVYRENPFKPIYTHRPSKAIEVSTADLCSRLGYGFKIVEAAEIKTYLDNNPTDFVLIAGAGLLPDDLVGQHRLINSHPGWLPLVRGLDSLKWAIHKQIKAGVTCHFVDSTADAGYLIKQKEIPVYKNDTFHSLAYRQYETEIELLVESIALIPQKNEFPALSDTASEPTRRMPKAIEEKLMEEFEAYKTIFAQD
jgi:phosphoribosylglycinamide formyltransferase-1